MTHAHRFAAYIEEKSHRKVLFWFFAGFASLILIIFELLSFLPPQVKAASRQPRQGLDQPIVVNFLGSVSEKSLVVKLDPPTPYKTRWSHPSLLVQALEIVPQEIFRPSTHYYVNVEAKNWFGLTRRISLQEETSPLPKVLEVEPANGALKVTAGSLLKFKLTSKLGGVDYLFAAQPAIDHTLKVTGSNLTIVPKGRLAQGQNYAISLFLLSSIAGAQKLYEGSFTTLDPLVLVEATPANASTSVSKYTSFSFKFGKPVDKATLEASWQVNPKTEGGFTWKDPSSFEFVPSTPLQTATSYTIKLATALAGTDGSQLVSDQTTNFQVAGAVKVLGINPSGSYVGLGSSITVNFDQPVNQASAQDHFSISPNVSGGFSWNGNSLIFKPSSLAMLTTYKVALASGIKSMGGEDSTQLFSGAFTTTSERTRVIGYSSQHRSLTAYYFGTGPKRILLVGCLHGLECNTATLLNQWVDYLRANQGSIASDRTFIIIPVANPDGKASNQRFNANGVDLNRNWDASWQAQTYWLNGTYPNGGGSFPFSEAETVALRDLILSENPVRIVSYHAAANLVVGYGLSSSFRDWYASKSGYGTGAGGVEDFGYPITGTLEEWATSRGTPSIVVELSTTGSSEYSRNLPALKDLLANYSL